MNNIEGIFIPTNKKLTEKDIWSWYNNIYKELELIDFTQEEKDFLIAYYKEAGLMKPWRSNFFRRHYSHSFYEASSFLMSNSIKQPKILDLGIGTGTQALLLCLLGAEVIGLDLDTLSLGIAKKRHTFYEKISGKKLLFDIKEANCFDIDYSSYGLIDGLYSMFAFNMMQPSEKLINLIAPFFSKNFRFVVIDGNNKGILARLLPSRKREVWSPIEFSDNLLSHGLTINKHEGKITLPPVLWGLGISTLSWIDNILNKTWVFPVSHQILASKESDQNIQ